MEGVRLCFSALWEGAFEDPCFYVYAPLRIAALLPTHISMDIIPFKCSTLSSVLMRKEKNMEDVIILSTVSTAMK